MEKKYFTFLPLTFPYNSIAKGFAVGVVVLTMLAGCAVNRVTVQTTIQNHPIRLEIAWGPEVK